MESEERKGGIRVLEIEDADAISASAGKASNNGEERRVFRLLRLFPAVLDLHIN